jgi:hypothetical protein
MAQGSGIILLGNGEGSKHHSLFGGGTMNSMKKLGGVSLSGILFFLGPLMIQTVDTASAADQKKGASNREAGGKAGEGLPCDIPEGKNAQQSEQAARSGGRMVSGEVLRLDGSDYVIKDDSGKEVKIQIDPNTEKSPISPGDRVSASINNQNHALWIRGNRGTDRRTEHVSADCNPTEEPSDKLSKKSLK